MSRTYAFDPQAVWSPRHPCLGEGRRPIRARDTISRRSSMAGWRIAGEAEFSGYDGCFLTTATVETLGLPTIAGASAVAQAS